MNNTLDILKVQYTNIHTSCIWYILYTSSCTSLYKFEFYCKLNYKIAENKIMYCFNTINIRNIASLLFQCFNNQLRYVRSGIAKVWNFTGREINGIPLTLVEIDVSVARTHSVPFCL